MKKQGNVEIGNVTTNREGQTQTIDMDTPDIERSLDPNNTTLIPYALYNISVKADRLCMT